VGNIPPDFFLSRLYCEGRAQPPREPVDQGEAMKRSVKKLLLGLMLLATLGGCAATGEPNYDWLQHPENYAS
jgi:hypothetical protein